MRLGTLTPHLTSAAAGAVVIRTVEPLAPYPNSLIDRLVYWAQHRPDTIFLAQRTPAGLWAKVTYAETYDRIRRIAAALIARGLSPERPVALLSGNGIDHALLGLAAMFVGIPYAPISPAYSLLSSDFAKVKAIIARLTPGLVYAADGAPYARAIAAAVPESIEVALSAGSLPARSTTPFTALQDAADESAVTAAARQVGPDSVAKILFTSGSTGEPKGVINTQRMLCSNQSMLAHWLAFVTEEPPVLLDWLPWHHTFGGNHNFGLALFNGGTIYIDDGKPTPAGIGETVRNLREVAPTIYFNVPKGYEELLTHLRTDSALRTNFYSRLRLTFYAGASLAPHVWRELEDLGRQAPNGQVHMVTSLGSTETAPAALATTLDIIKPGVVGLPLPGVDLKLVPANGKLEARVKGPTITPGYWRDEVQTAKAFDEDGFYKLGDALKFARDNDPAGGFVFDGRVSEDFKLATGTWVSVGPLRLKLIAALAPLARDAVIAGHDRDDVCALIIPDMDACRASLGPAAAGQSDETVLANPALRATAQRALHALRDQATGSSNRVERIILLAEPPSIDANEITDKGSINQRAVLARRAKLVEDLYADKPSDLVISAA